MTTGAIIGAVVGGIIGFWIGGPPGALIGAYVGFAAGMVIDPITTRSDVQTPGQPEIGKLVFTTADEGLPLPDVIGTTKLTGNILYYANNRSAMATVAGGGDMSQPSSSLGYKYYLTWIMGLCMGPADTLYTVFAGDTPVWTGEQDRPASGGEVTITLEDMGSMTLFFGTSDQAAPAALTALLPDATLSPAYRYQVYAFFNDCCIGSYNRMPTMKFIIGKFPTIPALPNTDIFIDIEKYLYNPALAVWYALTEIAGLDSSLLDGDSFESAAYQTYFEGRGVTVLIKDQMEALQYVETIMAHISGILRWGANGKMHLSLLRLDTHTEDMPVINPDMLQDDPTMERKSWVDTINEVKIQYSKLITYEEDTCEAGTPTLMLLKWSGYGYAVFEIIDGCEPFVVERNIGYGWFYQRTVYTRIFHLECPKYICSGTPQSNLVRVVDVQDLPSAQVDMTSAVRPALVWGGDKSAAPGGSVTIGVSGGKVPYRFGVPTPGWWFDAAYTKKEIRVFENAAVMDQRNLTIYHDGQYSDDATVTVRDDCDQFVTGHVVLT